MAFQSYKGGIDKCSKSLILNPLKNDCYYERPVTVLFHHNRTPNKPLEFPVYNMDYSCTTPSFILPCEKEYYPQQRVANEELAEIQSTIHNTSAPLQFEDSSSSDIEPRPSNAFCEVCRCCYTDYYSHIGNVDHHQKVHRSVFNLYIHETAEKFSKGLYGSISNSDPEKSSAKLTLIKPTQQLISTPQVIKSNSPLLNKNTAPRSASNGNFAIIFQTVAKKSEHQCRPTPKILKIRKSENKK